jgi:hypothetical protein
MARGHSWTGKMDRVESGKGEIIERKIDQGLGGITGACQSSTTSARVGHTGTRKMDKWEKEDRSGK